ncbi:MAG: vWA domain-containing protein [Pseudomonadota bacterium]|nr:vWA domain-containing protein [Pseudomonadota bacterium]
MKPKVIAIALLAFTATTVALYPTLRGTGAAVPVTGAPPPIVSLTNDRPKVEVAFVLDTTGSMGGLIQAAKEKIWSIASTMASAQPAPEIRMGLVAYRDRGDSYVTRVVDLSSDLDSMYATLMDFRADGGGDGPESVNQALYDGVQKLSWSQDEQTYRVLFLVGDAPPHMDYQDDVKWPKTVETAHKLGIRVNAIQCGNDGSATEAWRKIAALGQGRYFQVEQAGSAVAIATPYDARLAELSAQMDETRLYYGDSEDKETHRRKLEATKKLHESATLESRARRAVFNTSKSGETNFLGSKDLVDDVTGGRVDLADIPQEELPAPLQALPPQAQKSLVDETAERRNSLKQEMRELGEQRAAYLRKEVEERGGGEGSLDHGIYRAVRDQAADAGLNYEAEAPAY